MKVSFVEYMAAKWCLWGNSRAVQRRLHHVVPGHRTASLHQTVVLDIDLAALHLFDKATDLHV